MKLMKCCSPNGLSFVPILTFELFGRSRNSNMRDGVRLWQQVIPLRIGKAHANVAITAYIKYCLLPSFIFLLFFFFFVGMGVEGMYLIGFYAFVHMAWFGILFSWGWTRQSIFHLYAVCFLLNLKESDRLHF